MRERLADTTPRKALRVVETGELSTLACALSQLLICPHLLNLTGCYVVRCNGVGFSDRRLVRDAIRKCGYDQRIRLCKTELVFILADSMAMLLNKLH